MRFQHISLREASRTLNEPFQLQELMAISEYACYLYRCEGEMPLHRHPEHDELFWPQDRSIDLVSETERTRLEPGHLARAPRGWRHASASNSPAHVLLISRSSRSSTMNGHYTTPSAEAPTVVSFADALAQTPPNQSCPLIRCDTLQLYVEQVDGNNPAYHADHDVLVAPFQGSVGLRCGGIMTIVQEHELARVPAGSSWHLFGRAAVLWMTVERSHTVEESDATP